MYTIHYVESVGPTPTMYALVCRDDLSGDEDAFLAGELHQLKQLTDRLNAFAATGQDDGEISRLDERLGWRWLTVTEAAEQFSVPASTVRRAASHGHIRDARRQGAEWRFSQISFLSWLNNRPRPGPKPHEQ